MFVAEIKVSVIIPVYNAERFLEQSIKSVINQTYSNIEIIIVNDGSTDKSVEICKKISLIDKRVILINKDNEGAGKARLTGIRNSKGKYICFLDADDLMESCFIEKMLRALETNNADLVECGYYIFSVNTIKKHDIFKENLIYNKEQFREQIVTNTIIDGQEAVVLWNKMYRKDIIDKFVNIHTANVLEDYIFNMQYYLGVGNYVYLYERLIRYRVTENSLSRKYNTELIEELNKILPLKEKYMVQYNLNNSEYQRRHAMWYLNYVYNYLKAGVMCSGVIKRTKNIIKDSTIQEIVKKAPEHCLSKDISKERYNICTVKIFFSGIVFWGKRKLYQIKQKFIVNTNK